MSDLPPQVPPEETVLVRPAPGDAPAPSEPISEQSPEPVAPPEPEPAPAPEPEPEPEHPTGGEAITAALEAEPEPIFGPPIRRKKRGVWKGLLLVLFCGLIVGPVVMTAAYRILPPPVTVLMLLRAAQGHGLDYQWRGLDDISPNMVSAAVAAEDSGFCTHRGFDFTAMQKAMAHNERRPNGKVRGGSTISQQTAKNVFLWPDRTYVRKGLEAYFTVLTEAIWGKRRIMEMYLNVVEMGPGIYGAEAASQAYFGHSADTLSPAEADHLIAILPSPLKWKAVQSGAYVQRRSARIGARMGVVRNQGLAACVNR